MSTDLRPEIVDPCRDPRWTERSGCVFHTPEWLGLLAGQYGFRISAPCLVDSAGRIHAGVPIARVSSALTGSRLSALPFSDICPPFVAGEDRVTERQLAQELDRLASRQALALEVRAPLAGAGRPGAAFHRHCVALADGASAAERRFRRRQAMQGVRRAMRCGVVVERRTDRDALAAFYRLHVATRRRQGIPTQPRGFILRFADLFDRGLGFVLLAMLGDRPIAGAVYLTSGGVLTYKYGASDERFLDRRPNNLLFMESIRWGCEQGMTTLDLGRTDLGHESLRAFKLMWGADETVLSYTEVGSVSARRAARPAVPGVLATVIRHAPASVGRGIGEVLYRHAA
jgi:CelD/BcsL family acetyltransferase involved in cellulose biosynthesis